MEWKRIKVVLNYNNESYTIDVQRFKKLKYIKEKAYKYFYPIKTDIVIKYNNKSLDSLLEQSIGLIFNEKTFVRLMIFSLPGVSKSIKIKSKNYKKNLNLNINNVSKANNNNNYLISPNKNEILINNNSKIKYNITKINKSAEKSKAENSSIKTDVSNNRKNNLNLNKNGRKKLPPIKKEKSDIIDFNNCIECIKNITSEYCRKCNKFLCLNCANKNHSKEDHKLIEIDNNEKINIYRYKEELNKELYDSLKSFDSINIDESIDINKDIEKYRKNFNGIIKSLVDVAKGIKENLNEENHKELNKEENKEIIIKRLKKTKNEINNELKEYNENKGIDIFRELNLKDRTINKLIKEYKCETYDEFINNKIQNLFLDIENEFDNVVFQLEESINICNIFDM